MKNLAVLLIALLAFSVSAISQGSPDLFWDNTLSLSTLSQDGRANGCRLAVAPAGAQAMLLIEDVPEPLNQFPWKRKFTTITPMGVHVHSPISQATTNYGLISKTGQMVAYHERYSTGLMRDGVMLSTDYGQTFTLLTLPTSPLYPLFGDNGIGAFGSANDGRHSSVIGQDDKLYLLYFTTKSGVVSTGFEKYELNLLVVDINGNATHSVIARVSNTTVAGAQPGFINVTSTRAETIAVVRPGRTVTPRGGTTVYSNVPMAVVVDQATQNVQMISYGGTLGGPSIVRQRYDSGLSAINSSNSSNLRMISSDGENLFMINASALLPSGRAPYRLREFPKNVNSYAGFFTNTETVVPGYIPSWEPYMDLQSSVMDYGTYDTGFLGSGMGTAGGGTLDVSSKWGVGGVTDHSADFYILTTSDLVNGQDTVRRVRISHPNTPPQSFASESVEDYPVGVLQSMLGQPQSNIRIPYLQKERSHCSIEGAVISTFSYAIYVPPLRFYFHASDIS